jgi:hypothetical protein
MGRSGRFLIIGVGIGCSTGRVFDVQVDRIAGLALAGDLSLALILAAVEVVNVANLVTCILQDLDGCIESHTRCIRQRLRRLCFFTLTANDEVDFRPLRYLIR